MTTKEDDPERMIWSAYEAVQEEVGIDGIALRWNHDCSDDHGDFRNAAEVLVELCRRYESVEVVS